MWYKFVDSNFHPVREHLKTRDKLVTICNDCKKPSYVTLNALKKQVHKLGVHLCRSCSARKGTLGAKEKYESTMMERYGTPNPNQVPGIKEKIKKTSLERYGEGGSTAKARAAFMEKYGVANPGELTSVKEQIKETNQERYGVDNVNQLPENRNRLRDKIQKKTGFASPLKAEVLLRNDCTTYEAFCEKVVTYIQEKGAAANSIEAREHFNCSGGTLIVALKEAKRLDLIRDVNKSNGENELYFFIKSIYKGEVIQGDRSVLKPKELDIFLPELNLGIEYNGEIWHSTLYQGSTKRDYSKFQEAQKIGLKLVTLYENEWRTKRFQVELFLKALVNPKERIYARNTEIVIEQAPLRDFCEKYHLQGKGTPQSYYYGLVYGEEIVMVIAVSPHHRNRAKYVLTRVCLSEYQVVGGLEKLLKVQTNDELITWSDNRFSTGNLYKNSGFVLEAALLPDYFYIDAQGNHYSKQSLQKNQNDCPKDLTESQWALDNGLIKIYDCGKKRWKWKRGVI